MSSFVDDGWGEDEDLDVSPTGEGGDGWGDDDDFFDDNGGDEKEASNIGFPSAAPVINQSRTVPETSQSKNDQEDLHLDDGWGDDNDFFDDDDGNENGENEISFPPAAPPIVQANAMPQLSEFDGKKDEQKVDDGWGEDNDFFDDDDDDDNDGGGDGIGFPPAAQIVQSNPPAASTIAQPNLTPQLPQSNSDDNEKKLDDGWGEEDDFFDDDDDNQASEIGLPPAANETEMPKSSEFNDNQEESNVDDGWGEDDDFFDDDGGSENGGDVHFEGDHSAQSDPVVSTTQQGHDIIMQQRSHIPPPNEFNLDRNPMVTELANYIQSLDRMLSSINAVLEFEYNTCQKAEELLEYYDKRPQLAEYTRTKELERMNYEIFLPDGYVETNKERIIGENLLPDNAIVSRAANQSLLADILQVITGPDLIVRPQYLASCIATSCKFVIHKGDNGADMIDCRAQLSLYLPTLDGDRLNIAEVTVSVVFSPSQPMIEFRVVKIEVLLKDFSKLSSVAAFLREMDVPAEDHEVIDAPPDMYRDAFLEKSQRFFAISSEGMRSAFQQMDSVINLKGKMKSISSFMPDTDHVLAAEQEAMAFAEARRREAEQQSHRGHAFPRPPPQQPSNNFQDEPQNTAPVNEPARPKSILGGLVRSGWKTLASSVTIPDDDPAIYGALAPSQPPPTQNQPMKFYRKEEDVPRPQPPPAQNQPLKFYRKEEDVPKSQPPPAQNQPLKFYRKEEEVPRPQPTPAPDQPMKFYRQEEDVPAAGENLFRNNDDAQTMPNQGLGHNPQVHFQRQEVSENPIDTNCERNSVLPKVAPPEEIPELQEELREEKKQEVDGEEEEEVENDFEDGWDDGLDGFDDISDDVKEFPDAHKPLPDQEFEGEDPASDIVLVEKTVCDIKYDEEEDVCDTRRRWINPRPHRPYLKF